MSNYLTDELDDSTTSGGPLLPCFRNVHLGLLGRFWRWLGFYKPCERELDGYCARCHQDMYP